MLHLVLLIHRLSPCFLFLLIPHQSVLLLCLSQLPVLLLAGSIFLIPLSHLHNLFCFAFRFLNFLPSFLLLHFQQSDTIRQQFSIICSLFLIHSSFFERTCNLFWLIVVVRILALIVGITFVVLLLLLITVTLVTSKLLIWMFLSLRDWLVLFWRLDFFLLLIVH